ncbi:MULTISPECIES: peptidoglycan recognition protein family protein [Bacillus]|uniref:peptidoglycan recognition protein family protein n=1 Tax=Bacillus TaxID=1386 RepID=UPI00062DA73C|nr:MULTISPECIES: N-acetylmuramoyl-L-alanine amidase family protein [Bacillus]KLA24120.1 Phage N-acetylmuramoyl-L-alanine amidase [Bacillus cereus]MCU4821967.1 N-acetylmuramoyl-L-alanine amidase family protein [Bacillus cereus]MCU4854391.1 N-acetylmuramoyl-L-alanine amidase family protein [Bacillus cereus]MCU4871140.1 N-acetylmuramoyl-L-alanine amidase family protein [Bacillus cereus]MCU4939814.1 N-acetylmuramoyl-L-alanine amidase family protein [Bacillus cereus]
MEIRRKLVDQSKYSIKCPNTMTPEFITVHNTYNDASAENEISYMIGNNNSVSFHVAVDDKEAVQGIPFDRNAWHAGDGNGNGNRKSIGVEICYSLSGGDRYYKAEDNAAIVIAQLMKQFNIPISNVRTHKSWSGKHCPHRMLDEGRLDQFIEKINKAFNKDNNKPLQPKGLGIATSKYPEGWGINLYSGPGKDAWFTGNVINTKMPYLIIDAAWYGGNEKMLCLGWEAWAKEEHFEVEWFHAYSKYPAGYGINTYDGPNGKYKGNVDGSYPYGIFARKDGYIDIGQNTWVKEEHFNVR